MIRAMGISITYKLPILIISFISVVADFILLPREFYMFFDDAELQLFLICANIFAQ